MPSLIHIPSRYDIVVAVVWIELFCTDHPKPESLRTFMTSSIGVDEIIRLVEAHEQEAH
jgi:hypothetical protein